MEPQTPNKAILWVEKAEKWVMTHTKLILAGIIVVLGGSAFLFLRSTPKEGRLRTVPAPEKSGQVKVIEEGRRPDTPTLDHPFDQKIKVRDLFLRGLTSQQIAAQLQISEDQVQTELENLGLRPRKGPSPAEQFAAQLADKKQGADPHADVRDIMEAEGWKPGRDQVAVPSDPDILDDLEAKREKYFAARRAKQEAQYGKYEANPDGDPNFANPQTYEPLTGGKVVHAFDTRANNPLAKSLPPGTILRAKLEGAIEASYMGPIAIAAVYDVQGNYIGRAIGKATLKQHVKNRAFLKFQAVVGMDQQIQATMEGLDLDLGEGLYGQASRKSLSAIAAAAAQAFLAAVVIDKSEGDGILNLFAANFSQNLIQDARDRLKDIDLERVVRLERDQEFYLLVINNGSLQNVQANPLFGQSQVDLQGAASRALSKIPQGNSETAENMRKAFFGLDQAMRGQ